MSKVIDIKMVKAMAGPNGAWSAGEIRRDVPFKEAQELFKANAAVPHVDEPETADDKQPGKEDAGNPGTEADKKPQTIPKDAFLKGCEEFQAQNSEGVLSDILGGKDPTEIKAAKRHEIYAAMREHDLRNELDAVVEEFVETFGEDVMAAVLEEKEPGEFTVEEIPEAIAALHKYSEENSEDD